MSRSVRLRAAAGASPENIRLLREHGDELAAILAEWDEIDRLTGAPGRA